MESQLWNMALLAGPREQLEAAQYFESSDKALQDKAVILYHRAGMLHKALDLAFKTQQTDALQHIALSLDSKSDPAIVQKCAHFFVENGQYEKAVNLLAIGKQYVEALSLCVEHNIPVTEDLAEKLTMNKGEGNEATRVQVLEKVAEGALSQGNYHLATKKFTQAGNKVAAMKALLKSGDTEKIVFFANVSRQREIYVMAANYLQSLDWQNQPEILKNIVAFYTKGRSPDLLANFYVACAQVEVDEYQNYEKALGALSEASRCLAKVTTPSDPVQHQRVLDNLNTRMALVKRFVDIRRVADRGDHETALSQCRQLLQHSGDLDAAGVRVGDVYALMVDSLMAGGDFRGAQQLVEEFRRVAGPGVNLAYYLSSSTLSKLAHELGMPLSGSFVSGDKVRAGPVRQGRVTDQDEPLDEEVEVIEEEEVLERETHSPTHVFKNGQAYAI